MKDKAIAFLCVQPHEKLLDFANQIFDQLNIEVYIIY
jgi:hypothetical protein